MTDNAKQETILEQIRIGIDESLQVAEEAAQRAKARQCSECQKPLKGKAGRLRVKTQGHPTEPEREFLFLFCKQCVPAMELVRDGFV